MPGCSLIGQEDMDAVLGVGFILLFGFQHELLDDAVVSGDYADFNLVCRAVFGTGLKKGDSALCWRSHTEAVFTLLLVTFERGQGHTFLIRCRHVLAIDDHCNRWYA